MHRINSLLSTAKFLFVTSSVSSFQSSMSHGIVQSVVLSTGVCRSREVVWDPFSRFVCRVLIRQMWSSLDPITMRLRTLSNQLYMTPPHTSQFSTREEGRSSFRKVKVPFFGSISTSMTVNFQWSRRSLVNDREWMRRSRERRTCILRLLFLSLCLI